MRLTLFIARRYLFSKKKQNAINIISAISIVGVMIGTTALIVVLSVFNGMDRLLQKSTDSFCADLVVFPDSGKFFNVDSILREELEKNAWIASYDEVVEEKALLKYGDRLAPVIVKGVGADFAEHTRFAEHILEGDFQLQSGEEYRAVVGYGVAAELGIGLRLLTPMIFYYPDRNGGTSVASLHTGRVYPSALFASQQDLEGQYVLTDIDFARELFGIEDKVSKVEINLSNPSRTEQVKKALQERTGNRYRIEDKFELNRAFYAMMKSEKLAVFLILLFILLVASFNIVGSISMLILDKKGDLGTYKALGMNTGCMISVFTTEGHLITGLVALLGLVVGVPLC
ncbi:MAG: ABC transporter permease, partial [Odoribacter sp.]|nr:ABC transporter permease [Odoribacter sp.]